VISFSHGTLHSSPEDFFGKMLSFQIGRKWFAKLTDGGVFLGTIFSMDLFSVQRDFDLPYDVPLLLARRGVDPWSKSPLDHTK